MDIDNGYAIAGYAKQIEFGSKISRLDSNLVANNLLAQ